MIKLSESPSCFESNGQREGAKHQSPETVWTQWLQNPPHIMFITSEEGKHWDLFLIFAAVHWTCKCSYSVLVCVLLSSAPLYVFIIHSLNLELLVNLSRWRVTEHAARLVNKTSLYSAIVTDLSQKGRWQLRTLVNASELFSRCPTFF